MLLLSRNGLSKSAWNISHSKHREMMDMTLSTTQWARNKGKTINASGRQYGFGLPPPVWYDGPNVDVVVQGKT